MTHLTPPAPPLANAAAEPATLELTILMPCLDEAATVGACIAEARRYLERSDLTGEVLIADNGSTDGSSEIARAGGARVVDAPERGYGAALSAGIRAARGQYVIMADADGSYDFTRLDGFVSRLREGYDLVMGNRFAGGIVPGAMPFLHRYLGNPVLSFVGRLFFGSPVGDFHCGIRGFRKDAIEGLGLRSRGMEFASEMVVRATLAKLRITEVPTVLSPDQRDRPPHLRRWRDGWRHLRFLLLFSPRWLFLYPGLALMLLGTLGMVWLIPGPRHVFGVGLDVNTLVYTGAAVVCGFQAVAFAVLARVFAADAGLLPPDPRTQSLRSPGSLEIGVGMGLLLVFAGIVGVVASVKFWEIRGFGPLDPVHSLRWVVPSATAVVLGLQVVFASFFLSLLSFQTSGVR